MAKKKLNQLDPAAITLARLLGHAHPSTGKMNRGTVGDLLALFTGQTPVKTYADEAAMLANTDLVIGYIAFEADTETFYLYNGPTPDDINNYTEFGGAGTVTSITGAANRIAIDLTNPAIPEVDIDPAYDTAIAALIAAAQVGLWDDRGTFSAAGGAYPSSGGSGSAGAILKGDIWTISTGGTLPTGQVVEVGDTVRALIDTPGNTQANWAILQNNIGFTPENSANKATGFGTLNNTLYPTTQATSERIAAQAPNGLAVTDTTGTAIQFDVPKTYGSAASPETGNITLNSTGLIKGMVQLCLHNHSVSPTFGAEFFKIGGNYQSSQLNSIYFHAVSATRIEYTINQTS